MSDSSVLRREEGERTKTKRHEKWMQNHVPPNHDINRFRVQG